MGVNVGNVTVRFSVQDQEAVRKALEQLGRDGDAALRKIDAAGKPVSKTIGSVSEIMGDLHARATATAESLGPVGTFLTSLGPIGLAAGAAIGITVAGLFRLAEGADQLADKAGRIRDFGQQVGLTVAQVQAIEIAGADVGLKAEKIAAGLGKLSAEMEQTRRGTGALFEEAQRISPEFAEQLARARDLTQFIDRLSKAWDGLTESQRNALSRAALGRGIDLGRLFGQINEAGGLAALEQGLSKSIVLTNDQAKALDDLKDSAERLRTGAWGRFVSIFAESQLKAQLETAQGLDWISRSLKAISEIDIKQSVLELFGFVTGSGSPAVKLPDELDALKAQLKAAEDNRARLGGGRMGAIADATIAELRARIEAIERTTQDGPADVPLPQPRPAQPDLPLPAEAQLSIERQRMAVLGAAATPAEQLQLKMRELAASTDNWSRNQNEGNRALEAFIQGQARAAVATRTRLGVVSQEELITRGLNDLQDMRRNGFIRSAEEMTMAERVMRKEVETTSEAVKVRNSDFPALTRLATDTDKLALNLDQGLTSALHSSTSDLVDMAKGTETLSEGLTNLSTKILETVANAMLMKSVVGPISNALSGGLSGLFPTPVPSALGNVFDGYGLVPFAAGGIVSRPTLFPFAGGTGLMGERGPEAIMPLGRLPDGRLGVAGNTSAINVTVNNHAGDQVTPRATKDGEGRPGLDIDIRRMVEDMGERMLSDRGSRWQRALSRTIGSNPASTIG